VTAIFIFLVRKNILLETMYCFTQKFWRGCSKNWRGLSPLALYLAPPLIASYTKHEQRGVVVDVVILGQLCCPNTRHCI